MKRALWWLMAGMLISTLSALAQDVRYNFDKNADFSKFKTYKWVTIKDAPKVNDLTEKQIIAAVDADLSSTTVQESSSYNTDWGYGGGWYRSGWYGGPSGGMTTGQTNTIYVGQLALDMYDSANKDLVWRGLGSKTIDPKAKPEKQQKNLTKTVTKMLKNYPPPVKK